MPLIEKIRFKGFKSFAKPTELVFPTGFSAIIGSNGSGKSNICDGLCFVLGKGSARELRAERAANLIYNGGKHDKPAKEAQVDIFFNNKSKIFPIDEEIVKITRIVKQTGQSVYKINDKTVTRQQILELLSYASIDPDGYNIVLQGDITRFAEMKPEERRQLVEDIAGIGVYEEKKEKSLRELEKVEARLKEVSIILTEREANLRELKKDRDQALRFKQLEKDLKNNKASLIYLQIRSRDKKKQELETKISELEKKKNEIQQKINNYKARILEIKQKIKTIDHELELRGEKEQQKLRLDIESVKQEIARTEERINVCKSEIEKLETRTKQLKLDTQETQERIKGLKKEKTFLARELEKLKKEKDSIEKQIAEAKELLKVAPDLLNPAVEFILGLNNPKVYGTIADLAETDPKYALALEVAAGPKIKAIVVEDDATAAECIELLRNHKLGTAIFLPLNKLKKFNPGEEAIKIAKQTEGLALQLVKFDRKFENAFRYVFGSTVVVSNLEEARKIGIGRVRMVTLQGDLLERSGAMIGGYRKAARLLKVYKFKTTSIEKLEEKRLALQTKYLNTESELRTIDLQIQNMLTPETERAAKIIKDHEKEKENFKKELQELNEKLKFLKQKLKDAEKEESKFLADSKSLIQQKNKLSEEIQKVETSIIREEEHTRNIESQINNLNISRAKLVGELEGLQKEFEDYKECEIKTNISIDELALKIREQEREIAKLGNVNLRALEIYEKLEQEYTKLLEKVEKLKQEKQDVLNMIDEIEQKKISVFMKTFEAINANFMKIFANLTAKGTAHLELENPEDPLNSGIDMKVKISSNKFLDIRSLSGGEKTLTALAFIFALQEHKPTPFYFLDEVDAALDKVNSELLAKLIKKYSEKAQYIVITHNDSMISEANQVYGVAMKDGISKVVSLKL